MGALHSKPTLAVCSCDNCTDCSWLSKYKEDKCVMAIADKIIANALKHDLRTYLFTTDWKNFDNWYTPKFELLFENTSAYGMQVRALLNLAKIKVM